MSIQEQLRSVIEWLNPDPEVLFIKWTDNGDEIKNLSKLIIGPGQGCIFVYEGQIKAEIVDEGVIDLKTGNAPFWTTIKSIMQNFESHHKVGIYYFRKADIVNRRWGTPSPVKYIDSQYGFPVGLGAFGNYSIRITKPADFFRNIVAGAEVYPVMELQKLFLSRITEPMSDYLAKAKFSYTEIDSHRTELSNEIQKSIYSFFTEMGFQLLDFKVEGTNFDDDTIKRIAKIADMGAEAQAAKAAGIDYVQSQQLQAMRDAAKNEGMGGFGVQMGVGMEMGKMMAGGINKNSNVPSQSENQSSQNQQGDDAAVKLKKLKQLFESELIDENEYKTKKSEILKSM